MAALAAKKPQRRFCDGISQRPRGGRATEQANIPNFPVNHNASIRWRGSTAVRGRPLLWASREHNRRCLVALGNAGGWWLGGQSRRQSQAGEKKAARTSLKGTQGRGPGTAGKSEAAHGSRKR